MPSAISAAGSHGARRIAVRANRCRPRARARARRPHASATSKLESDMALETLADRARVEAILQGAVSASTADETEVLFSSSDSALTRYTRNEIHENVVESDVSLSVRAVVGKRVGVASTNRL